MSAADGTASNKPSDVMVMTYSNRTLHQRSVTTRVFHAVALASGRSKETEVMYLTLSEFGMVLHPSRCSGLPCTLSFFELGIMSPRFDGALLGAESMANK